MAQYVFTMARVGKVVPPNRTILKDISLSFFPGAKIGVLGLNGSGKSSLLRIMAGLDQEHLGEARPMADLNIGYLPQEPEIDAEKENFADAKAEIDTRIKAQNALVAQLDDRNQNLMDSLEAAQEATKLARADIKTLYLEHYDRVRVLCKRPPYVAQIVNQQCSGCHLRVSNEVARLVHDVGEVHFCDQCGRIVFI